MIFLYFACLLPSIAFGSLNDENTRGAIGKLISFVYLLLDPTYSSWVPPVTWNFYTFFVVKVFLIVMFMNFFSEDKKNRALLWIVSSDLDWCRYRLLLHDAYRRYLHIFPSTSSCASDSSLITGIQPTSIADNTLLYPSCGPEAVHAAVTVHRSLSWNLVLKVSTNTGYVYIAV